MEHETIISGGKVVDGTGANARRADVAIDGGRITRIGDLSGGAAGKTIDASGKIVTPGFVDLHTHLDAQAGWDAQMSLSSSCWNSTRVCAHGMSPSTKPFQNPW